MLLASGEIRVVVSARGATDAEDRAVLEELARQASGIPSLTLSRRCPNCGRRDHGAPAVDQPGLFVSLSRSSGKVAFAVSGAPVGIDIENVASVALHDLGEVAFTSAERLRLASATDPDRLAAELWTGKEAVLKLRGTGLRVDPGGFELTDAIEPVHLFDAGATLVGSVAGAGRLSRQADVAKRSGMPSPSESSASDSSIRR